MTIKRLLAITAILASSLGGAHALPPPATPLTQDPIGPIVDVTADAATYQPSNLFCIAPNTYEFAPAPTKTYTGADPVCEASGFAPAVKNLVKISIGAPPLCEGCHRLFLDYSKIPAENTLPYFYAHGHYFMRFMSFNASYSIDPVQHSPNMKDFTNDKLFVPDDAAYAPVIAMLERPGMDFTGNTSNFVYSETQGPYYAGRWYLNKDGVRINGAYVDVRIGTVLPGGAPLNEFGYGAAFYSREITCPNSQFGGVDDGDGYYGGCFDRIGEAATTVDPFER